MLTNMLIMDTMGKRIRIARFNANLDQKQLAGIIDVPKEYISYWESDKRPPTIEHIHVLAKTLKVSPNYLFGIEDSGNLFTESQGLVSLRLAGEVSCGNLTYATSENGEYVVEEMPAAFFSKYGNLERKDIEESYFILHAKGDSMSPYIEDRDTLVCRRASDVESGKIGVVINPESEATVKIISKSKNEIRLIPINPRYNEFIITEKDGEFRIIAEVVYVLRRVRTFIL